jgi:allantoin racemase
MRIVIVNPNTTPAMTETIAVAARQAASSSTEIVAVQPSSGPVSIEGVYDGALAVPGVIEEILRAEASGCADAYIIACFDDTGLDAARSAAVAPVIGIGEAAFHVASLVSNRFAVITTLARSVSIIERNLTITGLAARCARVHATDIPVLALEDPASNARARISDMIEAAIRDERADGIVLGCAGMANLAADLSAAHRLPVIEGVSAATHLAETLVALRLTTSKFGLWASPLPKSYSGPLAHPKNSEAVRWRQT